VELFARLDPATRLRVLCGGPIGEDGHGRGFCRGELARVWTMLTTEAPLRAGDRVLVMPDGWKEREPGHWVLTNRSKARQAKANAAVAHGKLAPDLLAERAAPRNRRRGDFAGPYGVSTDDQVLILDAAGILADCPRCGHGNRLTPEKLALTLR